MKVRIFLAVLLILFSIITLPDLIITAADDQITSITSTDGSLILKYDSRSKRLEIGTVGNPDLFILDGFGKDIRKDSIRKTNEYTLDFQVVNPGQESIKGQITAVKDGGFKFTLNGSGIQRGDFVFSAVIAAHKDDSWVIPDNEGLLIPVTDSSYVPWEWGKPFYQGHGGFSMPFIGITNGKNGCILIVETPDDCLAKYKKPYRGETSSWSIIWQPSQNEWHYQRKFLIQYVPEGGYVGIAKAYRQYAQTKGLIVTLREKAKVNPNVDRLIGAVDLWFWKKASDWWRESDCRN